MTSARIKPAWKTRLSNSATTTAAAAGKGDIGDQCAKETPKCQRSSSVLTSVGGGGGEAGAGGAGGSMVALEDRWKVVKERKNNSSANNSPTRSNPHSARIPVAVPSIVSEEAHEKMIRRITKLWQQVDWPLEARARFAQKYFLEMTSENYTTLQLLAHRLIDFRDMTLRILVAVGNRELLFRAIQGLAASYKRQSETEESENTEEGAKTATKMDMERHFKILLEHLADQTVSVVRMITCWKKAIPTSHAVFFYREENYLLRILEQYTWLFRLDIFRKQRAKNCKKLWKVEGDFGAMLVPPHLVNPVDDRRSECRGIDVLNLNSAELDLPILEFQSALFSVSVPRSQLVRLLQVETIIKSERDSQFIRSQRLVAAADSP